MTLPYIPHLILTGLMGIHCEIITVSKVSVKAGGSITIPCLYELRYINHVKYLCKGYAWFSCSPVVKTSQTHNSGKASISDDTRQTIFTVTIDNLTHGDTYYWCAVEIAGWLPDVKKRFQLLVTAGKPSLYVDYQEIAAFERGSVTVMCRYEYTEVPKWCRLGNTCVTGQAGSINVTTESTKTSVPNVFTVTMSELTMESSGWYWFVMGDLQMPVHITVHEVTSTTTTTTSPRTFPTITQHSSLPTSADPHTAQPTNSTINGTGGESLEEEHKSSTNVLILITILVLLLLIVPAAIFGWRVKRRNKTNPEGPEITAGSQTGGDSDELYATIVHNRHVAAQKTGNLIQQNRIPEESVTYSTIVMKNSVPQMTEPADGSGIYSTLCATIQ